MTTYESALSELSSRLIGTDSTLTTSLSDILAAALQELIEAALDEIALEFLKTGLPAAQAEAELARRETR